MPRSIVLVVEDDPAIRRGLVDTLGAGGYDVRESDNGEDGLMMALGGDIDLALLDVMLPGMDGFDLLEQIRKSKPSLPAIMVTARGEPKKRRPTRPSAGARRKRLQNKRQRGETKRTRQRPDDD